MSLVVDGLGLTQGAFVLDGVGFTVPSGSYAVLMGPTGCGKSTIVEAICGLRRIRAGRIVLDGRELAGLTPGSRDIGYVPQDGALFPTMTVADQLAFAPRLRRWPRQRIAARTAELAAQLGIGHLLARRPHGLSGGERQRVALGRALAARPRALLMDEPLSALDEATQDGIIALLRSVHRDQRVTVLHVTHGRREADALAEVRLEMRGGAVVPAADGAAEPHPGGDAGRASARGGAP